MNLDIFHLLEELEIHIARLYEKMKVLSRFIKFKETFQMMQTVSNNHSLRMKELYNKYIITTFDKNKVIKIHDKIKNKLYDSVVTEMDEKKILLRMADSEEEVGKLYLAISLYYKKQSEFYDNMSKDIDSISKEEYEHRDALLKLI